MAENFEDFVVNGDDWYEFQRKLQDLVDAKGYIGGLHVDRFLKEHEEKSFVPPTQFVPQNSFQVWLLQKIAEHWPNILPLMRDHRRSWWAEIVQQLAEISPAAPIGRVLDDHYNNFARSYFEHQVCSLSWVMKSRRTGEEWPVTRKRPQGAGFMRILGNLVGREEWTRHHPGAPEVPPPSAELTEPMTADQVLQDCNPWFDFDLPPQFNPPALSQREVNYVESALGLQPATAEDYAKVDFLGNLHVDSRFGRINSRLGQLAEDIEELRSRVDSDTGHLVELEERIDAHVAELMKVGEQVADLLKAKSEPADAGFDLED